MKLLPTVSLRPFSECQDGDLLRVPWLDAPLAIAATAEGADQRFVVVLEGEVQGTKAPYYLPCNDHFTPLCFGDNFSIELALDGPQEIRPRNLFGLNGKITIDSSGWHLAALPARGIGFYQEMYLNLGSGVLTGTPESNGVTFAHWDLRLTLHNDPTDPVLVKFRPNVK
jgi:hypothetical protein